MGRKVVSVVLERGEGGGNDSGEARRMWGMKIRSF
jgi:hypothetical protein